MPRYLVEREMPGAGRLDERRLRQAPRDLLETLGPGGLKIQWLHSYVTDDKVYCVYVAPDEEAVRRHCEAPGVCAAGPRGRAHGSCACGFEARGGD